MELSELIEELIDAKEELKNEQAKRPPSTRNITLAEERLERARNELNSYAGEMCQ